LAPGVLGKTSGVRVIRPPLAYEYISAPDDGQTGCGYGCVETSQRMHLMERIMSMNWTVPFAAQNKIGELWLRRFIAAVARRWSAYRRRRVEQLAMAQLNAMSDHSLKDIGLTRSEIASAVRIGPFGMPHSSGAHEIRRAKWRGVTHRIR
jgi:uncharacterized protein YjiS (DUF1127 family)